MISENEQFYYDEELNTVKTLEGLNYTSYCNNTEITLVFKLTSNLLGSNEQEITVPIEIQPDATEPAIDD